MKILTARKCASVTALLQIKDVTAEDAAAIRKIWQTVPNRQEAREQIDKILRTHGVEYLGTHKRSKQHLDYCNAGDPYATTIVFHGPRMVVQCWGDLAEKNLIQGPEQY